MIHMFRSVIDTMDRKPDIEDWTIDEYDDLLEVCWALSELGYDGLVQVGSDLLSPYHTFEERISRPNR